MKYFYSFPPIKQHFMLFDSTNQTALHVTCWKSVSENEDNFSAENLDSSNDRMESKVRIC